MKQALVLLSGGMDSAVCLYRAVADHGTEAVGAVFFDWGQRTLEEELSASREVCEAAGIEPPVRVALDFPYGGVLTDPHTRVPQGRTSEMMSEGGVAPTFFPGRNIVMLAYAYGIAAARGYSKIYFGPNADDAVGYPDCREDFLARFEEACRLGIDSDIRLVLPLIGMSKVEIVREGNALGVLWEITFSCYSPVQGNPCGECDACMLRERAFTQARQGDRRPQG